MLQVRIILQTIKSTNGLYAISIEYVNNLSVRLGNFQSDFCFEDKESAYKYGYGYIGLHERKDFSIPLKNLMIESSTPIQLPLVMVEKSDDE